MHREKRLVLGCGYLGHRVARNWLARGYRVSAVTRSKARAIELARDSITPIVADISTDAPIEAEGTFDSVLFAVGFDRSTDQTVREVYVDGLAKVLHWLGATPPRRFLYISSTGVYGDSQGEWVDEDSACQPQRDGGKACLEAESLLKSSPSIERSFVLRLAGIYGPGRLPNRRDLLAGKPIAASENGFLNLIHVDDAATAVDLVLSKCEPPQTFNVTDGSPVVRGDYYREVAKQVGAAPPTFDASAPSERRSRSSADKRVSNARIVRELGFTPQYASYREGIAQSLREETRQGPDDRD